MPFYTILGHSRCQIEFDELVSIASRPVYRGSGRMGSFLTTFRPPKGWFCRSKSIWASFHPVKWRFGRMGSFLITFRPPKGKFGRRRSFLKTFRPPKSGFCRMGSFLTTFRPPKGGFARTKLLIAKLQAQASRHIELGAALVSSVYSMLKAPFHFLQQSSYVVACGKSLYLPARWRAIIPQFYMVNCSQVQFFATKHLNLRE